MDVFPCRMFDGAGPETAPGDQDSPGAASSSPDPILPWV